MNERKWKDGGRKEKWEDASWMALHVFPSRETARTKRTLLPQVVRLPSHEKVAEAFILQINEDDNE